MMLAGILRALRDLPEGSDKAVAARMGFLEWLMTLPEGCPEAPAARAAEQRAAAMAADHDAVELFCGHLRSVQHVARVAMPMRRGGAAGRRI